MKRKVVRIDIVKIIVYILQRLWFAVLCAELGFAAFYMYTTHYVQETYTAHGTMYVNNGNPNLNDYQYTSQGDLNSAIQLIKTYLVVVKSDQVMEAVTNRVSLDHPGVSSSYISSSLSMESVSETGVVRVSSTAYEPRLAADIVNIVMEVAPDEIIRVVGAGNIEIIDYATVPVFPNSINGIGIGITGAFAGMGIAIGLLVLIFLSNQKITDIQDLEDNFTPPVLASIKRVYSSEKDPSEFTLSNRSSMEIIESYAKLRMNLLYTLVGKNNKSVIVTSAISGEGKSTIASNLAISCVTGGKKVLLIDGDLRRACQRDIFKIDAKTKGLSEILIGQCSWKEAVLANKYNSIDILPAGFLPPNPSELLESENMKSLLKELEGVYDLILIDMPPINIVSDPLVLSADTAGCIFITRQNYTDYRDVRKALIAAEMTGMNILGFVFYGEKLNTDSYYSRRYYKSYYNKYDYRQQHDKVVLTNTTETVNGFSNDVSTVTKNENLEVPSLINQGAARWKKLKHKSSDNA